MKCKILLILAFVSFSMATETFYYQDGKKVFLKPIKNKARSISAIDFYSTQKGKKIGVSDTLIVQFKNTKNLDVYLSEFGLEKVEELYTNMYLLKVYDKSLTIKTANALYKKTDIEFAHPNFLRKRIKR